MKQRKIIRFFVASTLLVAAALYLVFSFNRFYLIPSTVSDKESQFTTLLPITDDVSVISYPASVPPPALASDKGGSLRQGVHNKFLSQLASNLTESNRPVFSLHKQEGINRTQYPLRLHLAFCVFRI